MIDTEEYPKHVPGFNPELWESEGEWRQYMVCIYTQREVKQYYE